MSYRIRFHVTLVVLSAFLVSIFACIADKRKTQSPEQTPTGLSPAILAGVDGSELPADNDLCLICHLDFAYDPITEDHLSGGVTCTHCHGLSGEHMNDETMMTSPDILHGRLEVDSVCMQCHAKQHEMDLQAVDAFRKKWENKKRENGRFISPESVCTDCHGLHTIARR